MEDGRDERRQWDPFLELNLPVFEGKFSAFEDGLSYLGKCEKKVREFFQREKLRKEREREIGKTSRFINYKLLAVARVTFFDINPK